MGETAHGISLGGEEDVLELDSGMAALCIDSVNRLKTTELYSFKGETSLRVTHTSTKLLLKNNNNKRHSFGFIYPTSKI